MGNNPNFIKEDNLCVKDASNLLKESILGKSSTHKDVPRYEGLYTVDTAGNIYGVSRDDYLKWTKAKCGWTVRLCKGGVKTTFKVANVLIKTFIDPSLQVKSYKDGDRYNINLNNLQYGIIKDTVTNLRKQILVLKDQIKELEVMICNINKNLSIEFLNRLDQHNIINDKDRQIDKLKAQLTIKKLQEDYGDLLWTV